jgi:hypothetical protein
MRKRKFNRCLDGHGWTICDSLRRSDRPSLPGGTSVLCDREATDLASASLDAQRDLESAWRKSRNSRSALGAARPARPRRVCGVHRFSPLERLPTGEVSLGESHLSSWCLSWPGESERSTTATTTTRGEATAPLTALTITEGDALVRVRASASMQRALSDLEAGPQ